MSRQRGRPRHAASVAGLERLALTADGRLYGAGGGLEGLVEREQASGQVLRGLSE